MDVGGVLSDVGSGIADCYVSSGSVDRIVMRLKGGTAAIFLEQKSNIHYVSTRCWPSEFFFNTALKYSVKPENISQSNMSNGSLTLLNISDTQESMLILLTQLIKCRNVLCGGIPDGQVIRDKIVQRCQKTQYDMLQRFSEEEAETLPPGDILVFEDFSVFGVSIRQYAWAQRILMSCDQ
jgi:hypothetical protein